MELSSVSNLNRLFSTFILLLLALSVPNSAQQINNNTSIQSSPANEAELIITNEFSSIQIDQFSEEESKSTTNDDDYYTLRLKSVEPNNYQIQLVIVTESPITDCQVSLEYTSEPSVFICLDSLDQTLESDGVLKINRRKLADLIIIRARNVISGCSETTQLRELVFKPNMPKIYHKSNNDCIYRFINPDTNEMNNLTVIDFPNAVDPVCKLFIKVSYSGKSTDLIGVTQAIFDSYESWRKFDSSIYLHNKYTIIRVSNCEQNTQPIIMKIETMPRNSFKTPINFKTLSINSSETLGDKKLNYFFYELTNPKPNGKISCFLEDYATKDQSGDCSSKLIIYGVNEFGNLIWYNHSCKSLGLLDQAIEFKDMKQLFVQFYVNENGHNDGSARSIEQLDFVLLKFNISNPNSISRKTFTKRMNSFSSRIKREDFSNRQLDIVINTPKGTQINFYLNEFNNAVERFVSTNLKFTKCHLNGKNACGSATTSPEVTQPDSSETAADCSDYVIVKLNKSSSRINSLYEENTNPKICNSIKQPQLFQSYTNNLMITFSFSGQYMNGQKPIISFNYSSQKICDDTNTKISDTIKFDSSKSGDQLMRDVCVKRISLPKDYRIIFYRLYWKLNEKGFLFSETDPEVEVYNPKSKCLDSDSLILSEYSNELTKIRLFEPKENYYCMDNPLNVYVTETSNLYLTYQMSGISNEIVNKSRPLVFETGYFGFKHEYNESDQKVSVDFSELIPDDISESYPVSFSMRIKVPDDKYLIPIISECDTDIKTGKIYIKSGQFEYLFKLECAEQKYTTMGFMNSELIIDFRNVQLTELRDYGVKFVIDYSTLPRVMREITGEFESNDFSNHYLSVRKEIVTYEWKIEVDPNYFIRLNVENITNKNAIERLKISDDRIDLYEVNEIEEKKSFLFASNKLKITLEYYKKSRTDHLPYVKFSYQAQPKVIQIGNEMSGDIIIENVMIKDNLDWLILAPAEYNILAKFRSYRGKGQLKFSMLNDGYKPAGYYHFDLNQNHPNRLSHATSFVLSKANQIRIEYFPSNVMDSFNLAYSSVKNVLTDSFGKIKPYYNNYLDDEIFSPKLTDQRWLIRAPYGKQIKLFINRMDLFDEKPCSKASIVVNSDSDDVVADSDSGSAISVCGRKAARSSSNENIDLNYGYLVKSQRNELNVKFVTHDSDEAVFWSQENGKPVPYEGFELFYVFEEEPGDCYFNQIHTTCNYTAIGTNKWIIKENEDSTSQNKITDGKESSSICFNCHLKSQLHLQAKESESPHSSSVLVSPVISKSKEYLRFSYKLTKPSRLLVKVVYEQDYLEKSQEIKRNFLLNSLKSTGNQWKVAMIKIGKLFYNYRVVFVLERDTSSTIEMNDEPVAVGIDEIQLFEKDLECESNQFPDTCFVSNQKKHETNEKESRMADDDDIKFCKQTVMPCSYSKCAPNALCVNLPEHENGYACQCGFGYTGQFCDVKIDPCHSKWNNCTVNSTCVRANSGESSSSLDNFDSSHMNYECKCNLNYYGKYCDQMFTPCKKAKNPCNQFNDQGICQDEATIEHPDKYKCACKSLYTGDECETKLEMQCSNTDLCRKADKHANCTQFDDNTFVCSCSFGFEGDLCENKDDCVDAICHNGGTCIDGINSFTCKCDPRYTGLYCEQAKICSSCNHEGTIYCDELASQCVCRESYSGDHCETKLDLCLTNTCFNGGSCYSNKTDHICLCPNGFTGKSCEHNMTVCDENHCLNDAICIPNSLQSNNNTEKFTCKCQPNFSGKYCEHFNDPCHSNPCHNGATCYGHRNSYKCGCNLDWTGKNCEQPINNCVDHLCEPGSECVSLLGTYICVCPPGRIGQYCNQHVDKCANNQCQNGKCVPNYMSYNYTCECIPGYEGVHCEKTIKRCSASSNPCFNDGVCIDMLSKYECKCPQIYSILNCNKTEYCSLESTKCEASNTDRCEGYPGGSKCICSKRYTGARCESLIDICEFEKPCRSGVCVSVNDTDYKCVGCAPGFTGKQCNQMINFCESMPCQNNATCLMKPNDYYCKCPDGFSGKNCNQRIEIECLRHKCQHNSVCEPIKESDSKSGYRCICDQYYEGLYCEKKIDLCKNVLCSYGYCVDGKCECDPRFPYCKKNSKCKDFKCENGGTCIDVIVDDGTVSECLCPPGLTGPKCETSHFCEDSISSDVCGNSKRCKTFNKNYICDCEIPFIGHGCQIKISEHFPVYLTQLKEERINREREACRFGVSNQSQIFIAILTAFLLIFTMIGFLIGHRMVKSFKKKYLSDSDFYLKRNASVNSADELITKSMIKGPLMYDAKTPISSYTSISRNDINKSGFSIPRPSVRLENKSYIH